MDWQKEIEDRGKKDWKEGKENEGLLKYLNFMKYEQAFFLKIKEKVQRKIYCVGFVLFFCGCYYIFLCDGEI